MSEASLRRERGLQVVCPPSIELAGVENVYHTGKGHFRWRAFAGRSAIMLLLVVVFAGLAPVSAVAGARLPDLGGLPAFGELPSFKTAPASPAWARAELRRGLSRGLARRVALADAEARAATTRGQRARVVAFEFGTVRVARQVIRAWSAKARRAHKLTGAERVGGGGWLVSRADAATVVWRASTVVGMVEVVGKPRASRPASARALARLADGFLQQPLASTAWRRVLAGIRADGSVSKQTALQAFSIAYARLPGVKLPGGKPTQIADGTVAASWILRFRSSLTGTQRRIVDRALGLKRRGGDARAATLGDSSFTPDATLTSEANIYLKNYALVGTLPATARIVVGKSAAVAMARGRRAAADALPVDSDGTYNGNYRVCRVRWMAGAQNASAPAQGIMLAHETFHCVQFALEHHVKAWESKPAWLLEGMATWAAYRATRSPYTDPSSTFPELIGISDYIKTPRKGLFYREYDAAGFFGHLDDATGDFFGQRAAATYKAPGNVAAFVASGGASEPAMSTWGSSFFRLPSAPAGWTMSSPFAPPGFAELAPGNMQEIGDGGDHIVALPLSTAQARLIIAKPLIHIRIDGPGRMFAYGDGELTDVRDVWLRSDGKEGCPEGTEGTPPRARPWSQLSFLAVTGGTSVDTAGTVEPHDLTEYCKPLKPARPPGGCSVSGGVGLPHAMFAGPSPPGLSRAVSSLPCGHGWTFGDPHMHTFDGMPYDFQAAGEYTVVKSTTDGLEIQAREQPMPGSKTVSVNTAVAMRVTRAIVEVDSGKSMVLRVAGRRVSLVGGGPLALPGGGSVAFDGERYVIRWPDGSEAKVWATCAPGLGLSVQPASARVGRLVGLLGDFDGNGDDDFVGRGGRRYDAKRIVASTQRGFRLRYRRYGPSWLISPKHSLFVYPRGKTTRSYRIKGFPSRIVTTTGLTAAQQAKAQKACRAAGVAQQPLLHDCVLDVGLTGDRCFASSAASLKELIGSGRGGWTLLSSIPDHNAFTRVATLAADESNVVAAYRNARLGSLEVATFAPTAAGIGPVSITTPLAGWASIDDPLLFAAPGGRLQMIVNGVHSTVSDDPLNATLLLPQQAGGSFGAPTPVSTRTAVARGAVLAADGRTPLFASNAGGGLYVNRGTIDATQIDLSRFAPGYADAPTLAYDTAGRLWLAWYLDASDPATTGLYLLGLDASTGDALPGATPQRAPASDIYYNGVDLPLACALTCRFVYFDSGVTDRLPDRLLSWAPGDTGPAVVLAKAVGSNVSHPAAAYAPDGRLWAVWRDGGRGRVFAKLGDANGVGGTPVELPLPPGGFDTSFANTVLAVPAGLVVATNWGDRSGNAGTAEWATLVPR